MHGFKSCRLLVQQGQPHTPLLTKRHLRALGSNYLYAEHHRTASTTTIDINAKLKDSYFDRLNLLDTGVMRERTLNDRVKETGTRIRNARTHFGRVGCWSFLRDW